jgi:small-conductance mechanosensitive channel
MQEVLASIIFLFIKHPYDVGDRVQINKEFYIVQEINLLSTVFMDSSSAYVQAPNDVLNTLVSLCSRMMSSAIHVRVFQWIQNVRRSKEVCHGWYCVSTVLKGEPQMCEVFTFDVAYTTSFHDLERLRENMLAYLESEKRDYQPVFNLTVKGSLVGLEQKATSSYI